MFKKSLILSIVLIVMISMCIPVGVMAAPENTDTEPIMAPCWTYIHFVINGLEISSSGLASMVSEIDCYDGAVNKVVMNNYLQRYVNGSWTTLHSWSQTTPDNNDLWMEDYYVYKGYNYRMRTYFYAYQGSTLVESTSLTSGIQYY